MKQLKCEMCGSNDLVKQDGVFVCQSCGCKYSVEEAKKLMIEGPVEVKGSVSLDNSQRLQNLYQLARRAKDDNQGESAIKYYEMISIDDPTSWEASFYIVYFKATECKIGEIASAANSIRNCLETVFELIKNGSDSDMAKKIHVLEVSKRVLTICLLLVDSAKSSLNKYWRDTNNNVDLLAEYGNRSLASADVLFTCGDLIERDYRTDTEMTKAACKLWKSGIDIWKTSYAMYDDHATRYSVMNNSYVAKLRNYQSDYSLTAPQYLGFPSQYSYILRQHSDLDFSRRYSSTSTSSKHSQPSYSTPKGDNSAFRNQSPIYREKLQQLSTLEQERKNNESTLKAATVITRVFGVAFAIVVAWITLPVILPSHVMYAFLRFTNGIGLHLPIFHIRNTSNTPNLFWAIFSAAFIIISEIMCWVCRNLQIKKTKKEIQSIDYKIQQKKQEIESLEKKK